MSEPIVLSGEAYGDTASMDMALAAKIMATLEKHYPGHWWDVAVNSEAGTAAIALMYPSDRIGRYSHMGVLLHLSTLNSESGFKKVMLAGGELLERRKLPRRGYREGDFQKAIEAGYDRTGAI